MKIYDKELNNRYRDYYNVYLNYLNDEFKKTIKQVIFADPSPITQIHSEFLRNPDITIRNDKTVINLYLKNDYKQVLRIEFWQ